MERMTTRLKRVLDEYADGGAPPVVVPCGGKEHTVTFDPITGEWVFHDHNVKAVGVVAALGGSKNACVRMRDNIEDRAAAEHMDVDDVYEWAAYGFSLTEMRAWQAAGGPREAARWVLGGVTRPRELRQFINLGVDDPEEAARWVQVATYGRKHDMAIVREFVQHGVESAREALAWREAGLTGPNLLPRYLKRGWTPRHLARSLEKNGGRDRVAC